MSTLQLPAVKKRIHADYSSLIDDSLNQFASLASTEDLFLMDTILAEHDRLLHETRKQTGALLVAIQVVLGGSHA